MSDLLQTLSVILALSLIMGVPFANHEIAPSPHHPPPPFPSHFICRLRCSDFTVAYLLGQQTLSHSSKGGLWLPPAPCGTRLHSCSFSFSTHHFKKPLHTVHHIVGGPAQPCCWQGQSWSTDYLGPQTMLCEDRFLQNTLKAVFFWVVPWKLKYEPFLCGKMELFLCRQLLPGHFN